VDAASAVVAPIERIKATQRHGIPVEVVLLNVQPLFNQRVSRFTRRQDRDALRAELSRKATVDVIACMSAAQIPYRLMTAAGPIARRIAEIAETERVDEILMGVRRHPRWINLVHWMIAQQVVRYTDIPVSVMARGREHRGQFVRTPISVS
jgi:nucleotide-binding universal stress UspA family protein